MKSVIMCSVVPLLSGVRCAFRLGVHFALQLRICTGFRCDETLSMSPKITLTCEYGRKSKPFLRPEQLKAFIHEVRTIVLRCVSDRYVKNVHTQQRREPPCLSDEQYGHRQKHMMLCPTTTSDWQLPSLLGSPQPLPEWYVVNTSPAALLHLVAQS